MRLRDEHAFSIRIRNLALRTIRLCRGLADWDGRQGSAGLFRPMPLLTVLSLVYELDGLFAGEMLYAQLEHEQRLPESLYFGRFSLQRHIGGVARLFNKDASRRSRI